MDVFRLQLDVDVNISRAIIHTLLPLSDACTSDMVFEDHVLDQALTYFDQFDRLHGISIQLTKVVQEDVAWVHWA